jgi:hypothetical protein
MTQKTFRKPVGATKPPTMGPRTGPRKGARAKRAEAVPRSWADHMSAIVPPELVRGAVQIDKVKRDE